MTFTPPLFSSHVFYLKTNRFDEVALKCFFHWVDIADALGAEIYVVIDNKDGKEKILSHYRDNLKLDRKFNFLSTYWDKSKEVLALLNIGSDKYKWINCGSALLTPFFHSLEHGIKHFWNIDADDSYFLLDPDKCAKSLNEAVKYANENNVDLLQYDFHYSKSYFHQRELGSFGVTYTINNHDYIDLIKKESAKILTCRPYIKKATYKRDPWNIDAVFSVASTHLSMFKVVPFHIENMWLLHRPVITSWEGKKLEFQNEPFNGWKIPINCKIKGIDIPNKNIKIDTGINKGECSKYLQQNFPDLYTNHFQFKRKMKSISQSFPVDSIYECELFEAYIGALYFMCRHLIIIFVANDSIAPENCQDKRLHITKSLGLTADLEKMFRYSYIAIVDEGQVVQELSSVRTLLSTSYNSISNSFEIVSKGYNASGMANEFCSVKVNGTEYSCNKRGLNIVVFDKIKGNVIDSVCFDTWDNKSFHRKKVD